MSREIEDRDEWNNFVLKQAPKSGAFLQSFEWGEFQRAVGRKVYRLEQRTENREQSWAQVIEHQLPFGKKYWFVPRGPIFGTQKGADEGSFSGSEFPKTGDGLSSIIQNSISNNFVKFPNGPEAGPQGNRTPQGQMISRPGSPDQGPSAADPFEFYHEFSAFAKKNKAIFIRFEPETIFDIPPKTVKTIQISPPATLLIDLTKSEDELLAGMHEKTRYNVRLAARKGVRVSKSQNIPDGSQIANRKSFEIFWRLMQETAKRDRFRTYPKSYYEKMLEVSDSTTYNLQPTTCSIELWIAEGDGKPLAAGIWAYFGDTVTYLHGASSSEHRNFMAPYLLHWEVMRDAKVRGLKVYDFWGIQVRDPKRSEEIRRDQVDWSGITRFKMGFGGEVIEYPGTYDLPISKIGYRIYTAARRFRRSF